MKHTVSILGSKTWKLLSILDVGWIYVVQWWPLLNTVINEYQKHKNNNVSGE
jgi:hypothetical protein